MNYFRFDIVDYAIHTRHLTLLQDLAYRRLLDWYFTHEKPIPADTRRVSEHIGMREHHAEVADVLTKFFPKNAAGEWTDPRCDAEIARVRKAADRARQNGRSGGRPAGKAAHADDKAKLA